MTHRSECPQCAKYLLDHHEVVEACATFAAAEHRSTAAVLKDHLNLIHRKHAA